MNTHATPDLDGLSDETRLDGGRPASTAATPGVATFEELTETYRGSVSRLACRLLGWESDVEDVVQDVFISALRKWKTFRHESSPWTWLARITINRCRSLERRRLLSLKSLWRSWRPDVTAPAVDGAERSETFQRVRDAVRSLPRRLREVTVLRYLEEMEIEEIARTLGIARKTVDVRLHRARHALRGKLAGLIEEDQ